MAMTGFRFPDEDAVLEGCDRLVDFHAWDPQKINPRGWLGNFDKFDRGFALIMLSRFTFLADHLVDQLFRAAFQNISNSIASVWEPFPKAQAQWNRFCSDAIVTIVQGEDPNPSDSGWLFARKARQSLGISESQLVEPKVAVREVKGGFDGPVIFVDDFVGSGEQFVETWQRSYDLGSGESASFKSLIQGGSKAAFYYCNAMTTSYGRERLTRDAPQVRLSTGNLISERQSLVHDDSSQWPKAIHAEALKLVERIGRQLGFTAIDGGESDWRGFHGLGLGIAFSHSVPDANLPLFFTDANGWTPLVRRT